MQKLLYADLGGDTLADSLASAGSDFSFPPLIQGTKLKLGMRLVEEIEGEYVEVDRNVLSIRAKIGDLYAQPAAGTWRIWIGDIEVAPVEGVNLTIEIAVGAAASVVQAALNGLSLVGTGGGTLYGSASVTLEDGSYFVTFADETTQTPLRGANLRPDVISFLRVWASVQDGIWTHELRLDKAGLAFADQIIEELPTKPKVSTHRVGVDNGDGSGINARQKIVFNPRFRGIYEVRWSDRISPLLSRDDGPDQFGEALTVLADVDGEFIVTNPSPNVGMVEFAGSMGMQPQDELEIVVVDNPPADRYVVLDLGEKVCADVLRQMELDDADEVDVPFEIEIRYEDETDEDLVLVWNWQRTVTVRRRLIRDGEATVNDTDYMRPMNSRSYRPFNASQHASGIAFYPFDLGDGVNAIHTVDHNLHTLLVDVDLRENAPGGAWLVEGIDYRVNYDDEGTGEDAIVITLLGDYATDPPEAGDLIGVVVGREVVSEFQEDVTWEIPQTNGLVDELDAIKARLAAVEALAPGVLGALASSSSGKSQKAVPHIATIFPITGRGAAIALTAGQRLAAILADSLPRIAPRLYPAVHDATVTALATVLDGDVRIPVAPVEGNLGNVYENQTTEEVLLDVGSILPGQFAATDGEDWYPVEKYASAESSFYPAHLSRVLYEDMIQTDEMPLGSMMELRVPIEIALLKGNTSLHCQVVIETAAIVADTSPGTPGSNLASEAWVTTPHLAQNLILTAAPREYVIGYRVRRSKTDVLSADQLKFGKWIVSTAPAAAAFRIRIRLIRVDQLNAVAEPAGLIAVTGGTPFADTNGPDSSPNVGFLTIES